MRSVSTLLALLACDVDPVGGHPPAPEPGEMPQSPSAPTPEGPIPNTVPTSDPDPVDAGIRLPLEVFGPGGAAEAAFDLTREDAAALTVLEVQCSSCGYFDLADNVVEDKVKATLVVNGTYAYPVKHFRYEREDGETVDVKHAAITALEPDLSYGGIGGAQRTVRFRVALDPGALVAGPNVLRFEHTTPDTVSIGFRILDFSFRAGATGTAVRPAFVHEDPTAWPRLPETDPGVRLGAGYWAARNTLYDPYADSRDGALDPARAPNISASCQDCHADQGRDLKYFNFSNASIVERSEFHGLSEDQGLRIAEYIRSRPTPAPAAARPWNPPYQPGPGLDARPAEEWAAGAGLDAVLASDAEMSASLFPNGTSLPEVRAVVDRFGTLNMRELPIALQLPDWNQWLPLIHPNDAFDTTAREIREDERGLNPDPTLGFYEQLMNEAAASPTSETIAPMNDLLEEWFARGSDCTSQGTGGARTRTVNGDVFGHLRLEPKPDVTTGSEEACDELVTDPAHLPVMKNVELAKQGLLAWVAVKTWDLMHTNGLEDDAADVPDLLDLEGVARVPVSEARGWVLPSSDVLFVRAPHLSGFDSRHFTWNDAIAGAHDSTAWYHLQMVLNPGYRSTMPSHFPYSISWVMNSNDEAGVWEGHRYFATYIKMRQLQTNGVYGEEEGLDLRTAQPFWLLADEDGVSLTQASVDAAGAGTWEHLVIALLEDFDASVAFVDETVHPNDWDEAIQNSEIQPYDSDLELTPCTDVRCFDDLDTGPKPYDAPEPVHGLNTYRAIPELRALMTGPNAADGLDAVEALRLWSASMWPGRDDQNLDAWSAL